MTGTAAVEKEYRMQGGAGCMFCAGVCIAGILSAWVWGPGMTALRNWALIMILACIGITDSEKMKIPGKYTVSLAFIWTAFLPFESNIPEKLIQGISGALICLVLPLGALFIGRLTAGRNMLGAGDIKLMCAAGLFLGIEKGIYMILLSCAAIIIQFIITGAGRNERQPLGPAIAASIAVMLLF
ncbi:MAG: prepilin peptidase [Parasporobacterium sp.]|nr:prepilin peptidase [Parasporobacterium sp.]